MSQNLCFHRKVSANLQNDEFSNTNIALLTRSVVVPRTWKVEVVPFVFCRAEIPVMLANGWLTKLGSQ